LTLAPENTILILPDMTSCTILSQPYPVVLQLFSTHVFQILPVPTVLPVFTHIYVTGMNNN